MTIRIVCGCICKCESIHKQKQQQLSRWKVKSFYLQSCSQQVWPSIQLQKPSEIKNTFKFEFIFPPVYRVSDRKHIFCDIWKEYRANIEVNNKGYDSDDVDDNNKEVQFRTLFNQNKILCGTL